MDRQQQQRQQQQQQQTNRQGAARSPPPPLPTRRQVHVSSSQSTLGHHHRIPSLSDDDAALWDSYPHAPYDPTGPLSPPLRGRESLVSLQTEYQAAAGPDQSPPPPPPPRSPPRVTEGFSFRPSSRAWPPSGFSAAALTGGYEQIPLSNPPPPPQPPSRMPTRAERMAQRLSLLRRREPVPEGAEEKEDEIGLTQMAATTPLPADRSPPPSPPDELFLRIRQQQEAGGTLTGGLGKGFGSGTRVRDRDLLRSAPPLSSPSRQPGFSLARTFTRRPSRPSRAATIRGLGQDEANRRGEIIEVVMDHDEEEAELEKEGGTIVRGGRRDGEDGDVGCSEVDLSSMAGPGAATFVAAASSIASATAIASRRKKKMQIFYPKPNWRPFSMRPPYLVFLILLSVLLAASQEILFRRFSTTPIFRFRSPNDLGPASYFAVMFAPTMVSVVYGVLWQFTDFEVMRLEAFYQLSREGGALAGESINVDYVTGFNLLRPIRALRLGHYAVAVSSLATTLAVSLVPTFSAAAIYLSPDRATRMANPEVVKDILVRGAWSRLLTTTLLLCAVSGCVLLWQLQRRRSGLLADVRGVAGLASMAVASHILTDFRDTDTAKHWEIHHRLKRRRYVLRNSSLAPGDDDDEAAPPRDLDRDAAAAAAAAHLPTNPHPFMLRPAGILSFIAGLVLFLGFVPIFLFTSAAVVTEQAPFLVTALAVVIKLGWSGMESAVRMMEPFYILSRRHAPPKTLTLDYAAVPFGWLPLRALLNGHALVCLVGFGAVLAEVLTVLATSLSSVDGRGFASSILIGQSRGGDSAADAENADDAVESGQETTASFLAALVLSMLILIYMAVVATVVFVRRRHPFLPRQPNTIASVLAFIHQSRMLYDFVDTARLSNSGMVRHLEAKGKTYGLGWYQGRDGQMHCGVDEEELMQSYRHGIDFAQGNMPWNTQWDVL